MSGPAYGVTSRWRREAMAREVKIVKFSVKFSPHSASKAATRARGLSERRLRNGSGSEAYVIQTISTRPTKRTVAATVISNIAGPDAAASSNCGCRPICSGRVALRGTRASGRFGVPHVISKFEQLNRNSVVCGSAARCIAAVPTGDLNTDITVETLLLDLCAAVVNLGMAVMARHSRCRRVAMARIFLSGKFRQRRRGFFNSPNCGVIAPKFCAASSFSSRSLGFFSLGIFRAVWCGCAFSRRSRAAACCGPGCSALAFGPLTPRMESPVDHHDYLCATRGRSATFLDLRKIVRPSRADWPDIAVSPKKLPQGADRHFLRPIG